MTRNRILTGLLTTLLLVGSFGVVFAGGGQEALAGELTMWVHSNPVFVSAAERDIAAFTQIHPDVKIVVEQAPYQQLVDKIQPSFVAGTEPDILEAVKFIMHFPMLTGKLAPVPKGIFTEKQLQEDFYEGSTRGGAVEVKGKSQYFGIPAELNIGWGANILINRDAFNEAGVSEKSWGDWADFISDMQKLTIKDNSGNLTRSGLEVVVGSWAHVWVGTYHALGQGEVRDFNPDGTSAWDSDFGREVLQIVDNYVNKWKIASVDLADIVCLGNNKAAAQQQGPWVTAMYDADFPDLNWEYVRIPNLPGTKKKDPYYAGGLGGWAWFVSESSKNKGTAWEFLKFRADPKNAIEFNLETRTVPARRKTAADPRIADHPAYKEWIPVLPYQVAVDNYGVGAEEIRKNITDMVMGVWLKEVTIDEAITTAAKNVNEIRARYKEIKS